MTDIIQEQNFNSDSNPEQLNTLPPLSFEEFYAEYGTELNFGNESISPDDLSDLLCNIPESSNENLSLQRTETILADLQKLKRSIKTTRRRQKQSSTKIERTLCRQEQSIGQIKKKLSRQEHTNKRILEMLEQLVRPKTLNNKNSQRFVRPEAIELVSDFRSSTEERPTSRSDQALPTKSNIITIEENRNPIGTIITNEINSNGQLLYANDEIDKIRSEKNRGKIQIGQWCYEINVGTTDDASTSITATNHASVPIPPASPPALDENLSQHIESSSRNPEVPISNLINNYQLSHQLTTNNENLLSNLRVESTELCLLHPLKKQIYSKTDRGTVLTDCFGNPPVLIVCGDSLPKNIRIEMAMIFASLNGLYHSTYRLSEDEDLVYRPIKTCDNRPQRIELNDLKTHKMCNSEMKIKKIFILKGYPSGEIKDTMTNKFKVLKDEYHANDIQLVIRCFENDTLLLHGAIFYSNLLSGVPKKESSHYCLNISAKYPSENKISFDCNNLCQMEFPTEIPEPFHCTLISGYKWLEISIKTNNSLNTVYSIDTGDGFIRNPNYINIKNKSFKMPFKIVKQTLSQLINNENIRQAFEKLLSESQSCSSITYNISTDNINSILSITGLNCFHVQIRLLHSEGFPTQSSIKYYDNCAVCESEKYIEDIINTISREQEIVLVENIRQKRPNEAICDYSLGLPICKVAKPSENV